MLIHYECNKHGVVHGYVSNGNRKLMFRVPMNSASGIDTLGKTVNALLMELDSTQTESPQNETCKVG